MLIPDLLCRLCASSIESDQLKDTHGNGCKQHEPFYRLDIAKDKVSFVSIHDGLKLIRIFLL